MGPDKRKKSTESPLQLYDHNFSLNVESHYEQRIADLKESNNALQQAVEASKMTITLQEMKISDLEKKITMQVPKMLRVKLMVIGRTLKELHQLWEEASDLVADEDCSSNIIGSHEQRLVNGVGFLEDETGFLEDETGFLEEETHLFQDNEESFKRKDRNRKKKDKKERKWKNSLHPVIKSSNEERVAESKRSGKKSKKKKEKGKNSPLVPSIAMSPQPSTSNFDASPFDEFVPVIPPKSLPNRSKSSSSKNSSKSTSKKRKIPEKMDLEQPIEDSPFPTIDGADRSAVSAGSEIRAKRTKKVSKKKPANQSSFRIRPLRPRSKKAKNSNRSVAQRAAAAAANLSIEDDIIKREPSDWFDSSSTVTPTSPASDIVSENVEAFPVVKTVVKRKPPKIISMTLSPSSTAGDISIGMANNFEPNPAIEAIMMHRMSPKVVVTDIFKDVGMRVDPFVQNYKKRVTDASVQNGVEQRSIDSTAEWSSKYSSLNDCPEVSYCDSPNYVVNVSSSSDDAALPLKSGNFLFMEDFCIGDADDYSACDDQSLIEEL